MLKIVKSAAKNRHIMTGTTLIDPDIADSHGSTIFTLQELTSPKYGDVQHPMLVVKFETYCMHIESALEQLTPELV